MLRAVENVEKVIAPALKGQDASDQRAVDQKMIELDGTDNKSKLGANAILGVSMAVCRARAGSEHKPLWQSLADQFEVSDPTRLPVPMMNVINGGQHSDNNLAIQEFMIVPIGFDTFRDAIRAGSEIFHTLKKLISEAGQITAVGDEGGFSLRVDMTRGAFDFIARAIEEAGYGGKVKLAIDAAASEFFEGGSYAIDGKKLSSGELTEYYKELCDRYPLVSIEDSHSEDDWDGFAAITEALGDKVQFVGDDRLIRVDDALRYQGRTIHGGRDCE